MFDLNKALAEWKRSLRRYESFEDGSIAELESHLLDEFDKQKQNGLGNEEAFTRAASAVGRPEDVGGEYFNESRRTHFFPALILNSMKVARRNLVRQKGYSLINIFGLAVGLACCLLIAGYVSHEFCFEQTHPKRDRISRVWGGGKVGGDIVNYAGIGGPLGPAAAAAIPEIEAAVRLRNYDYFFSRVGASRFTEERIFFVDPGLFSMFRCRLVRGDPRRALTAPNLVVIDEPTARRYFGDQDPLGRTIRLSLDQDVNLQVSGVFRRLPSNTVIRSSFFASISTLERLAPKEFSEWHGYGMFHTFLLLRPQADVQAVQAKINALDKQHGGDGNSFHLQPLSRIHFDTLNICNDLDIAGNRQQVAVFAIIAGLILLIAAINFINLSTARAAARRKEVGIRKTCGASRYHLIKQFLAESVLLSVLAMGLGLLLWKLGKPLLDGYVEKRMDIGLFTTPGLALVAMALVFCVGLLAGTYPALYLSRVQPADIFYHRGSIRPPRFALRRALVLFQHAVAIGLIAVALLVFKQIRFTRSADLGFDKSNLLVCRVSRPENKAKLKIFSAEALRMPGVDDAAMMTVFPNNPGLFDTYRREGDAPSHAHFVRVNMIDEHFLHTFKMHLLSGRNFRTGAPSAHVPVIINETTVREFQLTDPIGQRFDGSPPLEVVGVVKDFHVDSLHYPISPVFLIQESGDNETLTLRINAGSRRADTLQGLRQLWERTVPGEEFSYYWGEDFIAAQYADDEKLAKLLGVFCLLALLVASLGVFGLAAHTAEVRTKEVGIRKALGASSISIMGMLSGEMVRWVLLANLLAWPLAWYAISRWLRNFAYRTAIGFGPLVIAGLLTLAVAWLTMGFHTLRAARANPVDSLRYE